MLELTSLQAYLLVTLVHVGNQHRDDVVSVVEVGVCLQDFTQAFSGQQWQGLWTKEDIKPMSHSNVHQLLFTTTLFSLTLVLNCFTATNFLQ